MEGQSEFVVEGQPQRVLRLIYEYVRTDWPHQGTVVLQPGIGDPNRVVYSEHPPALCGEILSGSCCWGS